MKIRTGFVSNSSSSSFVCNICERSEGGWDLCLSDAEMVETPGGVICVSHFHDFLSSKGLAQEFNEWYCKEHDLTVDVECLDSAGLVYHDNYLEDMPEKFCPVCALNEISERWLFSYMCKKLQVNSDDIREEVRKKFSSLAELKAFCK